MVLDETAWKAVAGIATLLTGAIGVLWRQNVADHAGRIADLTTRCSNLEKALDLTNQALQKCQTDAAAEIKERNDRLIEAERGRAQFAEVLANAIAELKKRKETTP